MFETPLSLCAAESNGTPWETCCRPGGHEGDHIIYTDHDHTGQEGVRLRWSDKIAVTLPPKGSRVRVVLEGEVLFNTDEPRSFGVGVEGKNGDKNRIFPDKTHVVSVEVISPPKPEFEEDDVILFEGSVYSRAAYGDKWSAPGDDYAYDLDLTKGNYTLLARDGKPVTKSD